jgi:hypothetical protein
MTTNLSNYKYQTGISSQIMNAVYAHQQKEYWCWTASITNVLRAYGINNVSQQQFAKNVCGVDIHGKTCDCPATNYDITRSLNFRGYDQYGKSFKVNAPLRVAKLDINKLHKELNSNKPVLVAYRNNSMPMGHAIIITGCECEVKMGTTYITKLFIRDPAPDPINKLYNGRKEIKNVTGFLNTVYAHWYIDVYK